MPEQRNTYTVHYKIRSYEVDHHQEASLSTICDYFQEAAGLHAQELHFDITDLQKKGLTWILYKMQVNVQEFPKRWESVWVTTWPSTGDGIRAYRDYELHDDSGKLLAAGLSQWMVLDIKKRKPVKIPDELMSSRFKTDQHVLELHKSNIPGITGIGAEQVTTASVNDLDMNRHVNNVRYIDWITGYNVSEGLKDKKCKKIVIQYASETKAGDKIYLSSAAHKGQENEFSCSLFKNDAETVIANAITVWL